MNISLKNCTEEEIDILALVRVFGEELPESPKQPKYNGVLRPVSSSLFSFSASRSVQRIRGLFNSSPTLVGGPVSLSVKLTGPGTILANKLKDFQIVIALLRHGFDSFAIDYMDNIKLDELPLLLSHESSEVREAASKRYKELTS